MPNTEYDPKNTVSGVSEAKRVCVCSPKVVSSISVVNVGDLLISQRILDGAFCGDESEAGYWDFSHIFRYVEPYIKDADYAVLNLETCFAGDKEKYCGFPKFNTPKSAFDAAVKAGFDMFLTASNHTYDVGYEALLNKIKMLQDANVDYIGTRYDEKDPLHKVVEINGIRIGMLNYAKEAASSTKERAVLNTTMTGPNKTWNPVVLDEKAQKRIATYSNKHLGDFFNLLQKDIQALKNEGADILVAYPHWGKQYHIGYQPLEDRIAQKMCDLGIDVIVGGHPHVVEPTKVYSSEISGKTTICIHSTGNFVSSMDRSVDPVYGEYTKDGVIFKYTVKKYSDGSSVVTSAEVLPLWVYGNKGKYIVIPLDREVDWRKAYAIASYEEQRRGYESYNRTMPLVEAGITQFNAMAKIAVQPEDATVNLGDPVEFCVSAVGKNIAYKWQYAVNDQLVWHDSTLKSANTANLRISSVTAKRNGWHFRCVVSTPAGTTYSRPAQLLVNADEK